jgi:hypothetical protein
MPQTAKWRALAALRAIVGLAGPLRGGRGGSSLPLGAGNLLGGREGSAGRLHSGSRFVVSVLVAGSLSGARGGLDLVAMPVAGYVLVHAGAIRCHPVRIGSVAIPISCMLSVQLIAITGLFKIRWWKHLEGSSPSFGTRRDGWGIWRLRVVAVVQPWCKLHHDCTMAHEGATADLVVEPASSDGLILDLKPTPAASCSTPSRRARHGRPT